MKKILFALLISFSITYIVQAQCFDLYVKTPNNSDVKACYSGGWPNDYVQAYDTYSKTFAIYVYENGTNSYNCHGFAWHVKEGGNKVWINNVGSESGNINAYWNDYSYSLYDKNNNPHKENLKVSYGSSDHSAITTYDPNIFISKMGCGALVSHLWNNSPYNTNNLKYYICPIITISGSSPICYGSPKSFSATSGWQPGYYWDKSSNLSFSSPTTNSTITVSAASSSNGAGWVSIRNSNGVQRAKYDVWVGAPEIYLISGPSSVLCDQYYSYQALIRDAELSATTSYQWKLTPYQIGSGDIIFTGNSNRAQVLCFSAGNFIVECRANNTCAKGAFFDAWIYASYPPYPVASYPNPATDILNIELNRNAIEQTSLNAKTTEPVYDIRLYDGQGNLLRQNTTKGGTTQFSVVNLPNGIYYLHIYDGVSGKPQVRQIVVEH